MKKILLLFLILSFTSFMSAYAVKTYTVSKNVQTGIKKYRAQNYAGALLDFNNAIKANSKDSMAYYYLGNLYATIGKKDDAIKAYTNVEKINDLPGLALYAGAAKACLSNSKKCGDISQIGSSAEINEFIRSGKFLDASAEEKIREDQLKSVKNAINRATEDIDFQKYKYLNDAKDAMPSDKEIADAVKTLAKVGLNTVSAGYNPQMAQLSLLGDQNGGADNFDMLPYLMQQGGYQGQINPQFVQNYMTNQMFSGFDFTESNRGY